MKRELTIDNNSKVKISREAQYAINISKALILTNSKDLAKISVKALRWTADEPFINIDFNTLMSLLSYHSIVLRFIRKAEENGIIGLQSVIQYYREELTTAQPRIKDMIALLDEIVQTGELPIY